MKKNIVKLITFGAGLYFLLEFMLPDPFPQWLGGIKNPFSRCFTDVNNFLMVLGAMGFLLGPINLTRGELLQVVRRRKGWIESMVYLVALVTSIVATIYVTDTPAGTFQSAIKIVYDAMFYGVSLSFYITSMGLVSFYLVSAAHRAFLLSNLESGLMMASASIVMLGLIPAGDYLNRFLPDQMQFGVVAQWILGCPNTAVQKAVLFGACGGAFAAAMRNWLSLGKSGD